MQKVFVALSGGVDSAVTAHMLQKEGYDISGVFIRVWQPDFLPCSQDEEERAAKRVAAHLGIPFLRCDLSQEYKRDVVDTMIAEYEAGRTPNPDVLCNAHIKFGAFLDFAKAHGADMIATGHHARVVDGVLMRGVDKSKDQAYFLWKLTPNELSQTLMPIGHMYKDDVRAYAKRENLPSAYKPDSQGLCFIGHVDMKTFLQHFITTTPGDVLNESGEVVGIHDGVQLVTIGQRGGFTLTNHDTNRDVHYVVAKDVAANTITVSPTPLGDSTSKKMCALKDTNWSQPLEDKDYTCEIRYHGEPLSCRVVGDSIEFDEPQLVALGQSIVVYDDDICLGGGIVA